MKFKPLIVIACLMIALLTLGCTGNSNIVAGSSLVHINNVSWHEYLVKNSGLGDGKYGPVQSFYLKYEFENTTYNGTAAMHFQRTQNYTVSQHNVTYVNDLYWDGAASANLYQRFSRLEDGIEVWANDTVIDNYSYASLHDTPEAMLRLWLANYTMAGKETLTINGITYQCDLYRGYDKSADCTYIAWIDPAIPVPVKMDVEGQDKPIELVGWG
jgi:hypothetical protein